MMFSTQMYTFEFRTYILYLVSVLIFRIHKSIEYVHEQYLDVTK